MSRRAIEDFGAEVASIGEAIDAARDRADDDDHLRQQLSAAHEELRVADEELRAQQEEISRFLGGEQIRTWQQERLLAALPCPVVVTTAEGAILSSNSPAAALLGMPLTQLLRRPIQSFVKAEERSAVRRDLSQAVSPEGQFRRSFTLLPRKGGPVPVSAVVLAQRLSNAQPVTATWLLFPEVAGEGAEAGPFEDGIASSDLAVAEAIVLLTQLPLHQGDRMSILSAAASICQAALGSAAAVSLALGQPVHPDKVATTSKLAQLVDGMQVQFGEGPCQSAYENRTLVVSERLADDIRWAALTPELGDVPVTWAVCCPVMLGDEVAGALNVYGVSSALPPRYASTVGLLAAAIAAVVNELDVRAELENTARNLKIGLASRTTIDQAKGIIMAVEHCGPDEAFAHLVAASTRQNRKLRDVAAQLVERTSRAG